MGAAVVRVIDVESSPEQVWEVLGDFAAISAWAPNVEHSCLLGAVAGGEGAVRRIQSGSVTLVETVVAWDPPTTLSYDLAGLPPVVESASNTWHVVPLGERTRVSLTSLVDAGPRPPQQLVARAVGRVMARASDQMLTGLRNRLLAAERGAGT